MHDNKESFHEVTPDYLNKLSVPMKSAENLFQSSCAEILGRKASNLKERLIIQFMGEEGMVTKTTM